MIVWTRWGILAFVAFGLSVGLGFTLKAIIAPDAETNAGIVSTCLGIGFLLGAAALWSFSTYALPRLDKPQPQYVHQPLPQPLVDPSGRTVTHRLVPVVNQETGQQVFSRPSSTLFFIPLRFWPYAVAAVGVINLVLGFIRD
ncbi:MAG: hypothetical protein ABIS84_05530 [Arachnia sp.]